MPPIPLISWNKERLTAVKAYRSQLRDAKPSHARENGGSVIHGMVDGMATTKITITLPDRQLEEIRKRVAAADSPSVSGFIQQAVHKSLENAAEFRAMVEEALKETGGPLKPRERAWARNMLSARKRRTKPRKAA